MKLGKGDGVVGMGIVRPRSQVLSVTKNGFGKRTAEGEFRPRAGAARGAPRGALGEDGRHRRIQVVDETTQEILLISTNGVVIRTPLDRSASSGARRWA